jgi:RNase H-fold protein (predicted Holliday junction resolvase)
MSTLASPILALDPGKDKCGVAIVRATSDDLNGGIEVLVRRIVSSRELEKVLPILVQEWGIVHIVVGDATTSRAWRERLSTLLPDVAISSIHEAGSTLEARALYWQANPPRGWRRVLPLSLQAPPEPLDDFAAGVLAQRFFSESREFETEE